MAGKYKLLKVYYIPMLIEMLYVTKMDLVEKKIPNAWSVLHILFFGLLLIVPNSAVFISFGHFYWPMITLVFCFILFSMDIMGAGDAKYLSTFLLVIPRSFQERFLENLMYSICLGVGCYWLITVLMYYLRITKDERKPIKQLLFGKIPFAPFILTSFILLFTA